MNSSIPRSALSGTRSPGARHHRAVARAIHSAEIARRQTGDLRTVTVHSMQTSVRAADRALSEIVGAR